jgi:hypothetical protein
MERIFKIDKTNLDNYIIEPSPVTKDHHKSHIRSFTSHLHLNFHKKSHTFFFKMHEKITTTRLDLCDIYVWCKHSSISERIEKHDPIQSSKSAVVQTLFLNAILVVQPLCSEGDKQRGCRVYITSDDNTVQIVTKRGKNVKGDITVGVSILTPNVCMECKRTHNEVKLRACERCLENDKIRVLYCSKECQSKDYDRHKSTCKADWKDDGWRKWSIGSHSENFSENTNEEE